ncbi:MAG: hypothetical protein CL538_05425 [Alcanivorax sp.]|nr:hypothetical protein [Alcanivorax sp.]|tara:strand:- start:1507 stop:1857 length:351 start_codon:yes stop_codon:yes gene_type:complete
MSPWQPIYLRAADEAAMIEALDAAGLIGADPETSDQIIGGDPFVIRVTVLPTLHEPTGETLTDGEGNEYPEMAPVPGYHVNVLVHPDHEAAYRAALADVLIDPEPETPHVKYAGCA